MSDRARLALRLMIGALCFLSGVAGLTYEVVWHRLLAVVLGNASFATAAVLAAVMGGMGLGAAWVGRRADRTHPLRLYGALEVGLGAFALAVPTLSTWADRSSVELLLWVGPGWTSFAVRFLIAGSLLLAPSFLLGATMPALARSIELVSRLGPDRVGRSVGLVYALNTAGAALGCLLTGYWLIGAVGVRATSASAAAMDLGVGVCALALSWTIGRRLDRPATSLNTGDDAFSPTPLSATATLLLAFVAGAVVLGLETVWTRIFLIVFGHDVHAFSAMLASVLIGLALGSAGYRALPSRGRAHVLLVPILFGALGVLALASVAFVGRRYLDVGLDVVGVDASLSITRSETRGLVLQALFAALTAVPTAAVAGAIFPALCARHPAVDGDGEPLLTARRAGRVLAANTLGSLVGPLVTPLALIPALGIQGAAIALATLSTMAGAASLRQLRTRRPRALATALFATLVLAVAAVPRELPRQLLARKIGPAHLDFEVYREGRSATVAVVRNQINGERQLFVNGINEVTTRLVHDQSFALLGHIGPLLHPDPRRVAVICLGAGLSAGAVARHDIDELVIVDLEPAVVSGAERFEEMNFGVLGDPRMTLVIDDGRAHLRTAATPYDVIVLDSTHPRAVDSWLLYTREFYAIARERLADDGILVQWLPLHGLSADEFRILVGTFRETFTDATLWTNAGFEPYGQTAYSLLMGTRGHLRIDAAELARRIAEPRVRDALAPWGLASPAEILECLHAGPDTLERWTRGLPVNTDDHPLTQFVTAYTSGAAMTPDRLLEAFDPPDALFEPPLEPALARRLARHRESQGLLLAGHLHRAAELCGDCAKPPLFIEAMAEGPAYYRALGDRYRADPDRLLEVAAGLAAHGLGSEAITTLEGAIQRAPGDPNLRINLGLLRAAGADTDGAVDAYRRAIRLDPDRALAHLDLGLALLQEGQVDAAVLSLERGVSIDPSLAATHAGLGYGLMLRPGSGARPEASLRRALELDPRHRDARANLGRLLARRRRWPEAVEVLAGADRYHPYDADLLYDLALALTEAGDHERARATLRRVLRIAPHDEEAAQALASLR